MSKLTLAQANTIINAAINAARASSGPPIAVVVVDDGGHVKASQREDGASDVSHRCQSWESVPWIHLAEN